MLCLGVAIFAAGFECIENCMSLAWEFVAIAAFTFFCFDLALGAGVFYAMHAWNWQQAMAVLYATGRQIWVLIRNREYVLRECLRR
jgi:hypothetical protein